MRDELRFLGMMSVISLTACGFPRPADIGDGGIPHQEDAPVHTDPVCFGNLLNICLEALPTQSLEIRDAITLDTVSSTMCGSVVNSANYCVVAATNIDISATLRATGTRPLILLATDSLTSGAMGVIDVGSHRVRAPGTPEIGAGADRVGCNEGTAPKNGGGGAGASFAGRGGISGFNSGVLGSSPGLPGATINVFAELRGGCPGQDGNGSTHGVKGHGGGAVLLLAGRSIVIGGVINAAGEGGGGAGGGGLGDAKGGGGGGSGGMIVFDAPMITVAALVLAGGGGGGAGAGSFISGSGSDSTTVNAALGGMSGDEGGNGGKGSDRELAGPGGIGLDGFGTDLAVGGGGGGGGGAGIIMAPPTAIFAVDVSPPVSR